MSPKLNQKTPDNKQSMAKWFKSGLFVFIGLISFSSSADLFTKRTNGFVPQNIIVAPTFAEKRKKKKSPTFGVIGVDSRTRVNDSQMYPYTAIGQLSIDDAWSCSGTMISPQHVLTAAHCVYNKSNNSFVKKIYFAPGRNGSDMPYGLYKVTNYYIPQEYIDLNIESGAADIAVLKLALDAGNTLGWLGLTTFSNPPSSIMQELEQQIVKVANEENSSNSRIEEVIDEFVNVRPDYLLNYFGFSGDKGGEMWGDECFGYQVDAYSTEKFVQVRVFCDDQPGASGSGYFDNNFYVSAVASWHKGEKRTNYLKDNKGRLTGNIEGSWNEVYNMNQGITDYTFSLINSWMEDGTAANTVHKNINSAKNADHLKVIN